MDKMTDVCPFCQIASGKLPARIVYQDDDVLAFHDIHPVAPTHILLIPTRHISNISETTTSDSSLLGKLLHVATSLAEKENLGQGYRLVVNSGAHGGQGVFHLHIHMLGGRKLGWPPG